MPAPASLYLTADPAAPQAPVTVVMTEPGDPDFIVTHTFPAGVELHGVYPTSSGRYRLTAMDGACALDLFLAPDLDTDVMLRVFDGGGCGFAVIRSHGDDGSHDQPHEGPDVLVVP